MNAEFKKIQKFPCSFGGLTAFHPAFLAVCLAAFLTLFQSAFPTFAWTQEEVHVQQNAATEEKKLRLEPTEHERLQIQNAIADVRVGKFDSALTAFRSVENAPFLEAAAQNTPPQDTQPDHLETFAGLEISQEAFQLASEYWFYRAVTEHQMLEREACLNSLAAFQELETFSEQNGEKYTIPARFSALTQLMKKDLEALQDRSLEMISRKMKSVERRLDFGNAGENVQNSEEEIIKMLDSMIDEMEQEAKDQQSRMSRSLKPGKPSGKAKPSGGKGPGHVTRRELKFEKEWGTLPEKEREEILQQLGRDFPPHYRDAIEQYFRRLAE